MQSPLALQPTWRLRGYRKPIFGALDMTHPLARGCVGCWLLGSENGGRALDLSPYQAHMTLNNFSFPTDYAPSHHGGLAYNFDNTNNYLNCAAGKNFPYAANEPLSISAWFYARSEGGGTRGRIIDRNSQKMLFTGAGTQQLTFSMDGGTNSASNTSAYSNNVWNHILVTCTGGASGTVKMYLNGASITVTGASAAGPAESGAMSIGTRDTGSTDRVFDGYLDCIRIWKTVQPIDVAQWLYVEPYAGIYDAALPLYKVGIAAAATAAPPPYQRTLRFLPRKVA